MWETHFCRRNSTFIQYDTLQCARARESLALKIRITEVVKPLHQGISPFSSSVDRCYKWSIALGDLEMRLLDQFCAQRERRYLTRRYTSRERRCVFSCESFGLLIYNEWETQIRMFRGVSVGIICRELEIRKWNVIWY